MKKIAFVILNYLTADETEKCIESIMNNCKDYDYKIYIIDNCSPDNSGIYLKNKYIAFSNVETIICERNLGFANGNNVGFNKAKYEYKADFIVLCNSDTEILTSNFCTDIINKYSALCYTGGHCCLSILFIIVYICSSQNPNPSPASLLATTSLFSKSVSLSVS